MKFQVPTQKIKKKIYFTTYCLLNFCRIFSHWTVYLWLVNTFLHKIIRMYMYIVWYVPVPDLECIAYSEPTSAKKWKHQTSCKRLNIFSLFFSRATTAQPSQPCTTSNRPEYRPRLLHCKKGPWCATAKTRQYEERGWLEITVKIWSRSTAKKIARRSFNRGNEWRVFFRVNDSYSDIEKNNHEREGKITKRVFCN